MQHYQQQLATVTKYLTSTALWQHSSESLVGTEPSIKHEWFRLICDGIHRRVLERSILTVLSSLNEADTLNQTFWLSIIIIAVSNPNQ
jgi:hypothetical protein